MQSQKRLGKVENRFLVWLIFLSVFLISVSQSVVAQSAIIEPKETRKGLTEKLKHDYVPGEVLVRFKQKTLPREREQFHTEANAEVLSTLPRVGVYRVKAKSGESTEELIKRYRKNPFVEYVEPNFLVHIQLTPNDPQFGQLYGLHNTGQSNGTVDADIDAPEAWNLQTGSNTIIVADIDTGVDYNHPDLAANMWTNPGEIAGNGIDDDGNGKIDDVRGWDFANNDNDPMDDHGHGTHTAGTIAAVGNNGVGIVGVAWQAKIMPLKFLDASGSGTLDAGAAAIIYAADRGAKISSNSWGCGPNAACFSQTLENAIAYANTKGMLFIVAAGNSNNDNDTTIFYPCTANQPNVICVAATDRNDQKASFSNFGATMVDLAAAGVDILSTVPTTGNLCCSDASGYRTLSGTSMAAPHVAGAAAVLFSHHPTSTIDQIKVRILLNIDPIAALSGITVTGGRLNVDKALRAVGPPAAPTGLTAVDRPADSGGEINLSWTPSGSAGNTQQRIYRSTTAGGSYSLIFTYNNNTATSHTDIGLTNGTRYYYIVRAYNGTLESANSNEANAIPVNNTDVTPPVISNIAVGSITFSNTTITWTTNEISDSQVEYGPTTSYGSSSPLDPAFVTSHSVVISGLSSATLYHYRVKSRDVAGNLTVSSDFTFTTATNPWSTKASIPSPRSNLAVGVVDGILYAVGGNYGGASAVVEAYNPATNTWSTKTPMPTARYGLGVGVINGILYAVGGSTGNGTLTTVEAYNPATNTWSTKASMPTARYFLSAGVVNGILYAIGGHNGTTYSAVVEAYDPATNTWSTKASMPTARENLAVGVINGILYAMGGNNTLINSLTTVQAYDPVTNTWSSKAGMPTARYSLAADVISGILYAVGGRNNTGLATTEAYDPVANSWSTKAPMASARSGLGVGVVSGILYAVAGDNGTFVATTEAYTASTNLTLTLNKSGTGTGTVTSSPAGVNCGATCSALFAPGTSVTLTATPGTGSVAAGFSGGCTSATTTCVFTINANTTVTAAFNDTQAPTAPTGLTATSVSNNQINLSWTASTDNVAVSGYWIERCQGAGCSNFARVNTSLVATTSYNDTGLTAGTTYRYRVQAADAAGNLSAYSSIVTTSTPSNQFTLTLTKAGTGSGTVTSSPAGINCGATCSAFFTSGTSVTLTAAAGSGSAAAGFSGGCTSGTTTCVFTINANTTVTATFNDTQTPTAPSSLAATVVDSSQINLSWTASTDNISISGYWIERCQGAGCSNFARVNTSLVTGTSYSSIGLTSSTSYSHRVQATDAAGNLSAYSNTVSTTTSAATGNTWAAKASIPSPRSNLAVGVVDGILYAVGGNYGGASAVVEAYNPATNTWSTKTPMPTARYGLGVGVINGILYAVGGSTGNGTLTTVEAYNPATNTWSTKASMPTARYFLSAGVVNGILYAIGGHNGTTYSAVVEAYDPATNTWSTKASMPTARENLAVGAINGILYAVGGTNTLIGALTTVQAYDPVTNTWSSKAGMPTSRHSLAVGVANGTLYAVGGFRGATTFSTNETYDPVANSWTTKASMPTARSGLAAGVINNIFYAVGGAVGSFVTVTEAYTPPGVTIATKGNP